MRFTEEEVTESMNHPWAYPGLPERNRANLVLLFWSNFSLGVWSCWSIFGDDKQFYVRRIEWARGLDRVRVKGDVPSTFGSEAPISTSEATRLLIETKQLLACGVPDQSKEIRLDGISRHLLLRALDSTEAGLSWFEGSVGTMPLDAWVEATSVALDNLLPQSAARRGASAA
jgi:hypothetical protein